MADRAVGIPVVRDGVPFIAGIGGAAALAWLWWGLVPQTVVLSGLTVFTAWFFRNPNRKAPTLRNGLVSPADGRVVGIEKVHEPRYFKEHAIRVSIFLNIFDVHVNRIPCQGTIEEVAYQPGRFLAANRPEATVHNEQNAVMIRAVEGAKVLCVQVAGLIARRIVSWVSPGETVACGERFGLIRFGSRVDVFFPQRTVLKVAVGDRVKGGETLLGQLPG